MFDRNLRAVRITALIEDTDMPYIEPADRNTLDTATADSLAQIEKKLGKVPNMFLTWANSAVALDAYVELSGVAANGKLDAKRRELVALAVGDANECDYCLAAHGAIGRMVGLSEAQIALARGGAAENSKDAALVKLARRIVESRGHVPTAELDAFKSAGYDDAAVLEVLVNVVLNIYTNYTNHLARTVVDFPAAPARATQTVALAG
jgi:uncharacterized peroxidase-related enzyme